MSTRPSLMTHGLSGLGQNVETNSPAEQRGDATRNFLKTMRPLPTQHYWHVFFDRQAKDSKAGDKQEYTSELEQVGSQIDSVQEFWRYYNNMPIANIKTRESVYLFKSGFRPIWEDRRNINGGSWTFRVPKDMAENLWKHVQMLAIGEQLEEALGTGDQLCGVGISARFNAHLITIWNRDGSNKQSQDAIYDCVVSELPEGVQLKKDNCYYKKHSDHAGFHVPPELKHLVNDGTKTADSSPTV